MTLDEIADYLALNSVGTVATNIFLHRMPDLPASGTFTVALYETGGSPTHRTMGPSPGSANAEVQRIQVKVRANDIATARAKARDIFNLLDHFSGTLGGVTYYYIHALQSPFPINRDPNEKANFVCNYEVTKTLS